MTHRFTLRVYYEDTDAGGMVYHAAYLRFAERARTEALRAMGVPHAEMLRDCNLMFVVRRIKVDYLRAARLDNSLEVFTQIEQVRAASLVLQQQVHGPSGTVRCLDRGTRLPPSRGKPASTHSPPLAGRFRDHAGRQARAVDGVG